jgi:hypothetical protein
MSVTDSDVKAVIDTTRDTSPFITTAQLVVDEQLLTKGFSADRLDAITVYLAAHFVAIAEPSSRSNLTSEKMGDASETYRVAIAKLGVGFNATPYGQQAIALDTSGTLAAMSAPTVLKAKINSPTPTPPIWLGGIRPDQIP